jgi:hypothetical protein
LNPRRAIPLRLLALALLASLPVTAQSAPAKTTPHMYVIDPKGLLVYDGAIDDRPTHDAADIPGATNFVQAALQQATAGKPVSTQVTRPYGCSVKYAR